MRAHRLSPEEVQQHLSQLEGWSLEHEKLTKRFTFDAYAKGIMFASAVGQLAESLDHHPDLAIGYQKVSVSVSTHDVEGLSNLDFKLAQRIEQLFEA